MKYNEIINLPLYLLLIGFMALSSCGGDKKAGATATKEAPESMIGDVKMPEKTTDTEGKPAQKSDFSHLNTGGMEWMTMDQLAKIPLSGSKMYLIDIYTEWCGWCKIMDKKTFSDKEVQTLLTENFHLVKFDAERKKPITFNGKRYEWKAGGRRGNNELALELLDGKMSYPSLVFLDPDLNVIRVTSGYLNPNQMIQELEIVSRS